MKRIFLLPCLILAFCFNSCDSSDKDTRIELASPKLKVTTELATATIAWNPIDKAAGYAYALDGATDFTPVEGGAEATSVTLTKLSAGDHTVRIIATGDYGHTMDSAERSIDFAIDPTLSTPSVSFENGDEVGKVIIKWTAVKGAVGYAYKYNGDSEWTKVGATVLSVVKTGLDPEANNTFTIYTVGQLPDSQDSAAKEFPIIDTSQGVWVSKLSGDVIKISETSTGSGIYTVTIDCKATDSFEIFIEGKTYGFTTYSGNGGVGTVTHANAAVSSPDYYVRESVGQMSAKEGDAEVNKFWVKVAKDCKVFVKVDRTKISDPNPENRAPRYYLQLVEDKGSILLEQHFDLMSMGSNWLTGKGGRNAELTDEATVMDGTEPATKVITGTTTVGIKIASSSTATPEYLVNRGLVGWEIENCHELLGLLRLSSPGLGVLTTPKLTELTGPASITLTFDALQFGSATNNIPVKVMGAGTISSAKVNIAGAATATDITPEAGNTSIIMTNVHCPAFANPNQKTYSTFTIVIDNATADTRINWDTTSLVTINNTRMCLDNIVIKKN